MSDFNDTPKVRRCSVCKQEFPLTSEHWHRDKRDSHGFVWKCKECAKLKSREWVAENRERNKENCKRYYEENQEQVQAYRKGHAEQIALGKRSWRKANPDKVKKQKSESQKRHRDSANVRSRRYIQNNPEKVNLRVHARIARKRELPFAFTPEDWERCLEHFHHCCAVCGRPAGFWHTIAKDHWIPVNYKGDDNPGTVPTNIVPLCHSTRDGEGGCNNSKKNKMPHDWLLSRYGKREAAVIEARIAAYFAIVNTEARP